MKQQQSASCFAGSGAQGQERVYPRGPLGKLTRYGVAALAAPAPFPGAPQLCSACGLRQPGALRSLPISWLALRAERGLCDFRVQLALLGDTVVRHQIRRELPRRTRGAAGRWFRLPLSPTTSGS